MSHTKGPGEGTWSVFAGQVVKERDEALEQIETLLDAIAQADKLLTSLMKSIQWGKTFDVDFALLNETLCLLPRVLAQHGRDSRTGETKRDQDPVLPPKV